MQPRDHVLLEPSRQPVSQRAADDPDDSWNK
jgi:hypothetical protein